MYAALHVFYDCTPLHACVCSTACLYVSVTWVLQASITNLGCDGGKIQAVSMSGLVYPCCFTTCLNLLNLKSLRCFEVELQLSATQNNMIQCTCRLGSSKIHCEKKLTENVFLCRSARLACQLGCRSGDGALQVFSSE